MCSNGGKWKRCDCSLVTRGHGPTDGRMYVGVMCMHAGVVPHGIIARAVAVLDTCVPSVVITICLTSHDALSSQDKVCL